MIVSRMPSSRSGRRAPVVFCRLSVVHAIDLLLPKQDRDRTPQDARNRNQLRGGGVRGAVQKFRYGGRLEV